MITVPRGRTVRFTHRGEDLPDLEGIDLILEQDVPLTLSSQFNPLVGGGSRAFSVLGGVSRDVLGFGFSGQFKQMGYQVWEKTAPLSSSINIGLHMKTNALKDVIRPALVLMKLPLPDDGDPGEDGYGLIPPGPSIIDALGDSDDSVQRGRRISCHIGNMYISNVIVRQVQPTFSSVVDDQGYPISALLVVQIETVFTATTNMIDAILGGGE